MPQVTPKYSIPAVTSAQPKDAISMLAADVNDLYRILNGWFPAVPGTLTLGLANEGPGVGVFDKFSSAGIAQLRSIVGASSAITATVAGLTISLAFVPTAVALSSLGAPTANISMAGYAITNMADPTNTQDATTKHYVDAAISAVGSATPVIYGGTDTGSGSAYVLTPTPAITSYNIGLTAIFVAGHTSTGASTLNISGLGAKTILMNGVAIEAGYIATGTYIVAIYDGTNFNVLSDSAYFSGIPISMDPPSNFFPNGLPATVFANNYISGSSIYASTYPAVSTNYKVGLRTSPTAYCTMRGSGFPILTNSTTVSYAIDEFVDVGDVFGYSGGVLCGFDTGVSIWYSSNSAIGAVYFGIGVSGSQAALGTTPVYSGQTIHLLVEYVAGATDTANLYLNGVLEATVSPVPAYTSNGYFSVNLGSFYINHKEIRAWKNYNSSVPFSNPSSLYNQGYGIYLNAVTSDPNFYAVYHCNEGTGNYLTDPVNSLTLTYQPYNAGDYPQWYASDICVEASSTESTDLVIGSFNGVAPGETSLTIVGSSTGRVLIQGSSLDFKGGATWMSDDNGVLSILTGISYNRIVATGATTIPVNCGIMACTWGAQGSPVNLQLLPASSYRRGQVITIVDESGCGGTNSPPQIVAYTGQTISGATSVQITDAYGQVALYCTGDGWIAVWGMVQNRLSHGSMLWETPGSYSSVTIPSGLTMIYLTMAGGGGGGSYYNGTVGGGGGGGGAVCIKLPIRPYDISPVMVVGAGGVGGNGGPGGNGGDTTLSLYHTLTQVKCGGGQGAPGQNGGNGGVFSIDVNGTTNTSDGAQVGAGLPTAGVGGSPGIPPTAGTGGSGSGGGCGGTTMGGGGGWSGLSLYGPGGGATATTGAGPGAALSTNGSYTYGYAAGGGGGSSVYKSGASGAGGFILIEW